MKIVMVLLAVAVGMVPVAYADDGVITVKSVHGVKTTADRLEKVLKEKGMNVFIRIDHAAGARKAGRQLRPTEVVIFGNPKVGTPLMQCSQQVAIDLPQKALGVLARDEHSGRSPICRLLSLTHRVAIESLFDRW